MFVCVCVFVYFCFLCYLLVCFVCVCLCTDLPEPDLLRFSVSRSLPFSSDCPRPIVQYQVTFWAKLIVCRLNVSFRTGDLGGFCNSKASCNRVALPSHYSIYSTVALADFLDLIVARMCFTCVTYNT